MDVELGRTSEARAEVAAVRGLNPQDLLAGVREQHPYKDPATVTGELAALSKAGLQ